MKTEYSELPLPVPDHANTAVSGSLAQKETEQGQGLLRPGSRYYHQIPLHSNSEKKWDLCLHSLEL